MNRTSSMGLLPRSGSPIAWPTAEDIPAMQLADPWVLWAYRSAVAVRLPPTMDSPRSTRSTHGYAWANPPGS